MKTSWELLVSLVLVPAVVVGAIRAEFDGSAALVANSPINSPRGE
jgi:hypothetical protein